MKDLRTIDHQYASLVGQIKLYGDRREDRTGVGTRALFGQTLTFDMQHGGVPLLALKRVYWKTAARELLWMLSGSTNIRDLVMNGVSIWTDWPLARYNRSTHQAMSREEFEDRIREDQKFADNWGDLGPVYGHQWRNWGGDQIAQVIEGLRNDPGGRRHIVEGWNVPALSAMALPPCHKTYQFFVDGDGRVGAMLYQRSCDVALGLPFNLFNFGLLTAMIAQQAGRQPGRLIWFGGDVHLYENHIDYADEIAGAYNRHLRFSTKWPLLTLHHAPDIDSYTIDHIQIDNYEPQRPIKAEVAV